MERWYVMKNKLISFLLLLMMLVIPLQANTSCKLILNGITYKPTYTPIISQKNLFLSLDDLVNMTYSTYSKSSNNTYLWSLPKTTLELTTKSKIVKVNQKQQTLNTAPFTVNDVLYVPISFLKLADYPYTLSSDLTQFELTSLLPYSTSTDTYTSHTTLSTDYTKLEDIFTPLLKEDSQPLIKTAIKYNQYLSFASSSYKKDILAGLNKVIGSLPELEVTFRNLDLLNETPTCNSLTTYPLKVTSENNGIRVKFNHTDMVYECLWPTYNPNSHTTAIDINKSLDVMIMRALYENYRDTYDLKDDIHFSPITTVQMGRSDSITYTVYSDHLLDQTHTYTVTIYKHITPGKINYIVDLGAHTITS